MYVLVTINLKNTGNLIITKRFGMHAFQCWCYNIETSSIFPSVVSSSRRSKIRIHKVGKQELIKSIV